MSNYDNKDVMRLLIVGNGFDKQCKLKSSFNDYFEYQKHNSNIYSRYNRKYPYYFDQFEMLEHLRIGISEIQNGKFCFWDFYFILNANKFDDEVKWADIENTMFNTFYTENSTNYWYKFITFFQKYLTNSNINSYADEEFVLALLSHYILNYPRNITYIQEFKQTFEIELLYKYLSEELIKFENNFRDYLLSQLKDNEQYREKSRGLLKLLQSSKTNIMSFNYTTIIKELPVLNIENVHGKLDDSTNIIGIDSTKFKYDDPAYIFTKTFRKIKLFTDKEQTNIEHVLSDGIEMIAFYGHSLNDQDYAYFQTVFDYYNLYDRKIKLLFYYSIYNIDREIQIKNDIYTSVIKLIEVYGNTLDNKAHGKNLLHKLLNEDRIRIMQI